jgi:bacteriocin-like protein
MLSANFLGYAADVKYRKDRLKQNPVVSNNELNQISGGLGDEAAREYGKRGLGKGIGQAFD